MIKRFVFIGAIWNLILFSCSEKQGNDPLLQALASDDPNIIKVMSDPAKFELQVLYTQIDRFGDSVHLKDFEFKVSDSVYFYPASTVKFPIAVAALEKLNQIDSLDLKTMYYPEGDSVLRTFEDDIIKIFAVSDNHASNRLIEFLGQDAINTRIERTGAGPFRLAHRLGYRSDNLSTLPLVLYLNDSTSEQSLAIHNQAPKALSLKGIQKGAGYLQDNDTIWEPFDFSLKNYYPIRTQHEILKRVVFPEKYAPDQRFKISEEQRLFLLESMKTLPSEAGYDSTTYYDSYVKFFLFGDQQEPLPKSIEIYNKVGYAYGTLTDCAYIVDSENQVEFMITATLLVNENGVFNDNQYEYETLGIPFLAALGRQLHQLEIHRN